MNHIVKLNDTILCIAVILLEAVWEWIKQPRVIIGGYITIQLIQLLIETPQTVWTTPISLELPIIIWIVVFIGWFKF